MTLLAISQQTTKRTEPHLLKTKQQHYHGKIKPIPSFSIALVSTRHLSLSNNPFDNGLYCLPTEFPLIIVVHAPSFQYPSLCPCAGDIVSVVALPSLFLLAFSPLPPDA